MSEVYPVIDYEDMIADLTDDVEGGFVTKDATLYIVRQKTPVYCEALGAQVRPVIEYFYEIPKLYPELKDMTVDECKKICFASLDKIEDEAMKAAVSLIIEDLKDYTKGNPGRNDRKCKVVFEAEDLIPMMVYYDDTDAGDEVESITVADLVSELYKSSN